MPRNVSCCVRDARTKCRAATFRCPCAGDMRAERFADARRTGHSRVPVFRATLCVDMHRHVSRRTLDTCIHICIGMCKAMCLDMCMGIDMCIGMRIVMCTDICAEAHT